MEMNQHTLRAAHSFEGKGLHTGVYTHMTVLPAPADTGIVFRRVDIPGSPEVRALAENVSNTARSTTISCKEAEAVTIEHIMSALTGMGVDNAYVELDNREVPILDGSARFYVEAFEKDGLEDQGVPRKMVEIPYAIRIEDPRTGSWVSIAPAEEPSAELTVDFNSHVLGVQSARWDSSVDYAKEIGPCRTFCFFHEIEYMYQNGLVKGGDVDNAIVVVEKPVTPDQIKTISGLFGLPKLEVDGNGYLNNLNLRFPDECGRHKLLDLLGDLRLGGGFLKARIDAYKPGHSINTKAAKALRALVK